MIKKLSIENVVRDSSQEVRKNYS